MLKNLFFIAIAAAVAVGIGYANQPSSNTVVVSTNKAPANNGKQMYVSYCAPCHGMDGRGQGPVAAALVQRPANLALLSKNNGGKYPATHVISVLRFGSPNPSHGTAEMPVWGPVLSGMEPAGKLQTDLTGLRITNLTLYLQSLQEK